MSIQIWQLITVLIVAFLFGFGIGRTFGESRAWEKMDKQEVETDDDIQKRAW